MVVDLVEWVFALVLHCGGGNQMCSFWHKLIGVVFDAVPYLHAPGFVDFLLEHSPIARLAVPNPTDLIEVLMRIQVEQTLPLEPEQHCSGDTEQLEPARSPVEVHDVPGTDESQHAHAHAEQLDHECMGPVPTRLQQPHRQRQEALAHSCSLQYE